MKVSKLFCIDVEIAEKLKQIDNSSSLVNGFLIEYFARYDKNDSIIEQKKADLKHLKQKSKEINKEMKIFQQVSNIGFDNFCIKWCFFHKDKSEEVRNDLMKEYIYGRRLKITMENFKKGYELVTKNEFLFKKSK
jgi:hypothetical protein